MVKENSEEEEGEVGDTACQTVTLTCREEAP